MAYKGNGAHKISQIYLDHEITLSEARIGDMLINKTTGMWDRIKEFTDSGFLTKHGQSASFNEVIIVRY